MPDEELLCKDLCARIPYGVVCDYQGKAHGPVGFAFGKVIMCEPFQSKTKSVFLEEVKLYLFPLSSMTEEQFNALKEYSDLKYNGCTLELVEWTDDCKTLEFWIEETPADVVIKVFDWLNNNHFDYKGLIEKGLAIDCTNLNIY